MVDVRFVVVADFGFLDVFWVAREYLKVLYAMCTSSALLWEFCGRFMCLVGPQLGRLCTRYNHMALVDKTLFCFSLLLGLSYDSWRSFLPLTVCVTVTTRTHAAGLRETERKRGR